MEFSYKDLSYKVGEEWDKIKAKNPISKDKCIKLQSVIVRLFPLIEPITGELKGLDWFEYRELKSVQSMLSHEFDMVEKCLDGFSYKKRIDALRDDIYKCLHNSYGRHIRPVLEQKSLEELEREEAKLAECRQLCASKFFNPLLSIRDKLNTDDTSELYDAFQLLVYYAEIQNYIDDIEHQEGLNQLFDMESSQTAEIPVEETACPKQENGNNDTLDEHDILLRDIFGEHLTKFLDEARALGTGSDVARLVNWYVREYKLEKSERLNSPLRKALSSKGIETASKATWNNIICNR